MDGSNGGGSVAPAPFVTKTYEMVEDPLTNLVVGWSHSGRSFVVWNPMDFARDLLPKYFKHNNFSSFVRQLNTYGFRKIDPEQWEFANDEFLRGQRHLLKNIYRRKPIYSHSTQSSSAVSLGDQERQEFEEEIERMKQENSLLQSELERCKLEKREFVSEIVTFGQSVKAIDHRQRQLMMFFAQLLQKPGLSSGVMQQLENKRKRRLVISSHLYGEAKKGEISQLVTCEDQENPHTSFPKLDLDLIDELESSIKFLENFMLGICESSIEDMFDFEELPESQNVTSTEKEAVVVGDNDVNSPPCFSTSFDSSSSSREIDSSPVLADSVNTSDTPANSSLCFSTESRQTSLEIDMNTSPAIILDADASKDQLVGQQSAPVSVSAGTNDVFWQQFFVETPPSTDKHEVASERRGTGAKKTDSRFSDFGKHCWNWSNLNNLPKELGHLTP